MVFTMGKKGYGRLSATKYLTEIWANKYNLRDLQSLTINGLDGATGLVRIKNSKGYVTYVSSRLSMTTRSFSFSS